MSKHLQFWSAISQCGSARHAINCIHYTQLTEAKLNVEPEHIISIFLLMIIYSQSHIVVGDISVFGQFGRPE